MLKKEIDLQEAEAFGKSMAERVKRICAGEKDLTPEIPTGSDAESLWEARAYESQCAPGSVKGGKLSI